MKTGMLWYDNDPNKALAAKVIEAMKYYNEKYGQVPNVCMVNPSALKGVKAPEIGKLVVRAYRPVLPGHLWIGVEDAKAN